MQHSVVNSCVNIVWQQPLKDYQGLKLTSPTTALITRTNTTNETILQYIFNYR